MPTGPARRAFISGNFSASQTMRPPGALPHIQFEDSCSRCGECARACEENIIIFDRKGYPSVDFNRGECTFCGACTEACEESALTMDRPWSWRAEIGTSCLSLNGVQCRVCQDHCPTRAIRFRLIAGGGAEPSIDLNDCTGCGACVGPCPVNAVQFRQTQQPAEAVSC